MNEFEHFPVDGVRADATCRKQSRQVVATRINGHFLFVTSRSNIIPAEDF